MVDVVVVAVEVTVTGVAGAGVAVCDGATAPAEATGTATAPAIPRVPTVLIAPAKMMLRRFFLMVLRLSEITWPWWYSLFSPESRLGRSVQGRTSTGYSYPNPHPTRAGRSDPPAHQGLWSLRGDSNS
jgi:hypothetical protein